MTAHRWRNNYEGIEYQCRDCGAYLREDVIALPCRIKARSRGFYYSPIQIEYSADAPQAFHPDQLERRMRELQNRPAPIFSWEARESGQSNELVYSIGLQTPEETS